MDKNAEIKRLIAKLTYWHPYIRFNAANALAEYGEDALPHLIEVLENSLDEKARGTAAYALGVIRSEKAIPVLINALELGAYDNPTPVASYACEALERIGTLKAQEAAAHWRSIHKS